MFEVGRGVRGLRGGWVRLRVRGLRSTDEGKLGAEVLVRSRLKIFGHDFIFVLRTLEKNQFSE